MKDKLLKRVITGLLIGSLWTTSVQMPAYANVTENDNLCADKTVSTNEVAVSETISVNDVLGIRAENTTDISSYLTIEDEKHLLEPDVQENLKKVFIQTWKPICDFFNNGTIMKVKLIVDTTASPSDGSVAYTQKQTVTINPDYFNQNKQDYDAFTHELVHVAQNYKNCLDTWLVEGIADYGRNKFGINNAAAGWKLKPAESSSSSYMDGYRTTAAFLVYIEENYKKDFVSVINQDIKDEKYSTELFKKYTGMDIDDLWDDYLKKCGVLQDDINYTLKTYTKLDKNMDVSSYLNLTDESNLVTDEIKKNIRKLFNSRYVAICNTYGMGQIKKVKIKITDYDGVAYTDAEKGEIVVSGVYLEDNPDDYDCITHELIHVAQSYTKQIPDWIVEGIADYGRAQLGVNNEKAGWDLPITPSAYGKYSDGYTTTAAFFLWIEKKYNSNFVQVLNQLCKEYDYKSVFFKKLTGYTINQLWTQYQSEKPKHIDNLGQICSDLKFKDKNGNVVKLSDFGNKPLLIYFGNWDANIVDKLKEAVRYQKILGEQLNIIFVYTNQQYEEVRDLMVKTIGKESFALINDVQTNSMFNTFAEQTDEGYLIGWPSQILLDQNKKVCYASFEYLRGEKTLDASLQKLFPKVDFNCIFQSPTKAVITNDANQIKKNQFKNMKKLKQITIGKNVKAIGAAAFQNCSSLTKLTLPGNCRKIGKNAFLGCKKLKILTIKSKKMTSKSIANGAFKGLSRKTVIKVPKSRVKAYTKLFRKKGLSKKIKVKAI